jgi:hypothetical protein
MALVTGFERLTTDRSRLHPTEVTCEYATFERDGHRYLQLETSGSKQRKMPGKVSQTLQFDSKSAGELVRVVRLAFPELS